MTPQKPPKRGELYRRRTEPRQIIKIDQITPGHPQGNEVAGHFVAPATIRDVRVATSLQMFPTDWTPVDRRGTRGRR